MKSNESKTLKILETSMWQGFAAGIMRPFSGLTQVDWEKAAYADNFKSAEDALN